MTEVEKLLLLKTMIEVSDGDTDAVLSVYLSLAAQEILNIAYPFVDDFTEITFPSKYDYLQVQAAAYIFNKRGAYGETAHNENGINRTYEAGHLPKSILQQITPECGFPKVKAEEGDPE